MQKGIGISVRRARLTGAAVLVVALAMMAGCPTTVTQDKSIWANHVGWSYVGQSGFSPGGVGSLTMAFQPTSGTPYVAFQDWNAGAGTLWRFLQGSWTQVGGPFSSGNVDMVNLAFSSGTQVYVSFTDSAAAGRASVARYSGSWSYIGGQGFSPTPSADNTPIVIDSSGNLYVGIYDGTGFNLDVMTSNGGPWSMYPAPISVPSGAGEITMNVDSNDQLSIAFEDGSQGNEASELRYSGAWVQRGSPGFTPASVYNLHSAVSPNGTQFIVYSDPAVGYGAVVMQFSQSSGTWLLVGSRPLSPGSTFGGAVIAIDSQGTPFVAFADNTSSNRVTVMKYDGTQWTVVGAPDFTTGAVDYLSIAIGPGDVPYVAFRDPSNGNKASVMAFQ